MIVQLQPMRITQFRVAMYQCRRLLEQHPQIVLDVDTFAQTLAEAKRMLPDQDIMHTLAHNPNMIFGFERRDSMIPYDS
jgi:hypothetical protein